MTGALFATLARLHGHLALLGLAVLLHPVLTLRPGRPPRFGTVLTADVGAVLLLAMATAGGALYPTYRTEVKPGLLAGAPMVALGFEAKEHLAYLAGACAVAAVLSLHGAGATEAGRRLARALLLAAWCCGVVAALLGLGVAGSAHPAW